MEEFHKHLNLIKSDPIKRFTKFALSKAPDYFWTLPASTTNTRHGGETLIEHVKKCLLLAEEVIKQFKGHWTQRQNDQLLSSLILHDCWRCGKPGAECRFTQEDIDNGFPKELLGKLKTSREHPEVGYQQLLSISAEFNCNAVKEKKSIIGAKDLQPILGGVRYHYGPWTQTKLKKPFSLDWNFSNVIIQVHNIDYQEAINSMLRRGDGSKNL